MASRMRPLGEKRPFGGGPEFVMTDLVTDESINFVGAQVGKDFPFELQVPLLLGVGHRGVVLVSPVGLIEHDRLLHPQDGASLGHGCVESRVVHLRKPIGGF